MTKYINHFNKTNYSWKYIRRIMRKLGYILLVMCALECSSCNDFLDVKPVGQMIPTEVTQFENLLNNTTTLDYFMFDNNRSCFYAYMGDNIQISENHAKYQFTATYPNLDLLAGYTFYTPVMDPQNTPFAWSSGIYKAAGYFNNVVDGVSGIDTNSEYAKGVIAQAKAGRAWIYLNAALIYGPMYVPGTTNDTKVIPCRTSGDPIAANGLLCTTDELLAQVKEDLDYACENCPASTVNPCRADRACAYALRAEYHMFTRNWENMLSDCQKAWELALANRKNVDEMIYNFADFYFEATTEINPDPGVSPEVYMTLKGPDLLFDQTSNRENLLYRNAPYQSSSTRYYPSDDWASIFDKEKDLRWTKFVLKDHGYNTTVGDVVYDDGIQLVYYRDELSITEGVTYPLLLLMKAEAAARTNNLSAALADLNLLRKYRYKGPDSDLAGGTSLSQDQLLNEILTERRREQPLVSFQRTLDLKRYAQDAGKPWSKDIIVHKIGEKTYSKSINDAYYQSLPIDNAILQYNPQWGIAENNSLFEPYNAW